MIRYRFLFANILLVISLLLTSGTSAVALVLIQEGAAQGCCEAEANIPASPLENPCSEPDCQCTSCFTFVMSLHPRNSLYQNSDGTSSFSALVITPPPEYAQTIDYPPE